MPETVTIDDVLTDLDEIVDLTLSEESPLAIFAYVYRRTTAKIAAGIENGRFEDNERMEEFDVDFAQRYIDAFWRYREKEMVSASWEVAFRAADPDFNSFNPVIMQHLLLGMNAHINLDLGISAAEIAPGWQINELEHDFMLVNDLLEELINEIQQRISRVSPMMFLLDLIGENSDEEIVNFSIRKARGFAWNFAQNLAHAGDGEDQRLIRGVDERIADLGNVVADPPGFLLPKVLSVIRFFEEKDVGKLVERLKV